MDVTARLATAPGSHDVVVSTDGRDRPLSIPGRDGGGSGVSGGELLLLALATCFGNDLFREAALRGIPVDAVEVTASAEFPAAGLPAENVRFRARVTSPAPEDVVRDLVAHTDSVAEIQATVRRGTPVALDGVEIVGRD